MNEPPPGWATDSLTEFLDLIRDQQYATFVRKRPYYLRLRELDACFHIVANNLNQPPDLLLPMFFARSHSAFRLACSTSMAGQAAETFLVLRSCLEYAGYALLIHDDESLGELWLRRHEGVARKKAVRKAFEIDKIHKAIARRDPLLMRLFEMFCTRSIDHGAHPNEMAVTGSATMFRGPGRISLQQKYLHADGTALEHALKSTAQVGLCGLYVFQWIYRAKFEILGVKDRLLRLRKGL